MPEWKNFIPQLQSPPHNTVGGKHYGISLQWGPNTLLYNTEAVTPAPTSWAAIYSPKYKGAVTVPDNPIQIADAALYLSKTKPSLGITDPYELTEAQLNAAVSLLKQQRPLIKKYWALASDEIELFKNGDAVIGAAWPLPDEHAAGRQSAGQGPDPGAGRDRLGGHVDALGARQAPQLRLQVGELGVEPEGAGRAGDLLRRDAGQHEGLPVHGTRSRRARARSTTPTRRRRTSTRIKFWKTPVADCGNGKSDCTDYSEWQQKWTEITA